jgi:Tfp pilus assembly protein PilE
MRRWLRHLFLIGGALGFCGCEKQAKINSDKLDSLADRLARQEQVQSNKMLLLQAQLALLGPQLDRETSTYFEKNHDAALFFHTNTLFLLLTIDKHIESQLQSAQAQLLEQSEAGFKYHTNQLGTMLQSAAHIEETMQSQLNQLEEKINAESARLHAATSNALMLELPRPTEPTTNEVAWQKQIQAELAGLKHELEAIKTRLVTTNLPVAP